MAMQRRELVVFSFVTGKAAAKFVPAGLLTIADSAGARALDSQLASELSYGTGYLARPESFEIDPVSLSLAESLGPR